MEINMNNVILVEDNKIERKNISYIIETVDGCRLIDVFSNGNDALDYLKKNKVDIVITDVQMPKMDGIELTRSIRQEKIEAEIIIISGYNDFDNAKNAVGLDVVDYVMKPILDDELEVSIKKAIARCEEKQKIKTDYEMVKKQIESSKQLLQDQFIRSLIVNTDISQEYIRKNEELFGINLTDGHKMVFIMHIKEQADSQVLVILYAVLDCILKYKNNEVTFFPFMVNENEVGAIAVSVNCDAIISRIIQLKNKIISDYSINVFVGVSSVSNNICDINRQYSECKSVLKEINNSKNIVVLYDDVGGCDWDDNIFVKMQRTVRRLLLENDIKGINEFLLQSLKNYSDTEVINKRNFAYEYVNVLEMIGAEFDVCFEDGKILTTKVIWEKLADFNSIIDVTNFLGNITMSIMEQINASNKGDSKVVNEIKSILENHYSEHITVGFIAKELHFSARHIQRIFSQNTGMTIFEYLTNYRIEVAKKMLMENISVDEVVYQIGYKDKIYFQEIFKVKTGFSPKQFKDIMQNNENI
ncbi:MAG: response regulator [Clostridia bacterium]|nr:response regulator [Clostridia bacterium]